MLVQKKLIHTLALLGLIPFLASIVDYYAISLSIFSLPKTSFIAYSAIILSFLCGTLWGLQLYQQRAESKAILLISNVFAVSAWLSLLIEDLSTNWALAILSISYLALSLSEFVFNIYQSDEYRGLRTKLNFFVSALHLPMFF